jgi:hypothetical protein
MEVRSYAGEATEPYATRETVGYFVLAPEAGHAQLTGDVWSWRAQGTYRPYAREDDRFAPAHLETDGARWTERDGPTAIFDALGHQRGLAIHFPPIPSSGVPGSKTPWELVIPPATEVLAVEASRGKHPAIAAAFAAAPGSAGQRKKRSVTFDVVYDGFGDTEGVRVTFLRATGRGQDATYAAQWSVLPNGRLLTSTLEIASSSSTDGDPVGTEGVTRELRLVEACDGPVVPRLIGPLGREELAIHRWGRAVDEGGDPLDTHAALYFDEAVKNKHGVLPLLKVLAEFRTLRSAQAMGDAAIVPDTAVTSDEKHVRLVLGGVTKQPNGGFVPVDVTLVFGDDRHGPVVESVRIAIHDRPKARLLEIDDKTLFVERGWPAP